MGIGMATQLELNSIYASSQKKFFFFLKIVYNPKRCILRPFPPFLCNFPQFFYPPFISFLLNLHFVFFFPPACIIYIPGYFLVQTLHIIYIHPISNVTKYAQICVNEQYSHIWKVWLDHSVKIAVPEFTSELL